MKIKSEILYFLKAKQTVSLLSRGNINEVSAGFVLYVCTVRRENIHSIEWCQFLPGPESGRHYNFSLQEPGCGLSVTFEPLEVINFNPVVLSCPKQSQTILSISATSSTTNRVISNSSSWRNWCINCFKHRKVISRGCFSLWTDENIVIFQVLFLWVQLFSAPKL